MDWVALQNTAKAKGELVFAMRQEQTAPITEPGPWGLTQNGYCLGLASTWISLAYQGKNFPIDGNKVCDNPPWRATIGQNLAINATGTTWQGYWKVAAEVWQMTLSKGLVAKWNTMLTGALVHSIASKAYGCYGITVDGSGGTHAIAVRHARDNKMHFFDANYGHFVVSDHNRLKSFLDWYWKATAYDTAFLESSVAIVGIRPPIT